MISRSTSPAPNSSKAFTFRPSKCTVNGAGKVCQRKLPRSTVLASQPEARVMRCKKGCALRSSAVSMLHFSGLRPQPCACHKKANTLTLVTAFGAPCSTAPRRRKMANRRENSCQVAKVDGSGLDQARSPSILSSLVVITDRPIQPASSACSSISSMRCSSASVALTLLVARSRPITATRSSE